MIASKVVCDDNYMNKSWAVVGQAILQLREIRQMEREMYGYLECQPNVDYSELESFTEKTQSEFGSRTVPTLTVLLVTSSVAPAFPKATRSTPTALSRIPQPYNSSSTMNIGTAPPATILTSAVTKTMRCSSLLRTT